MSYHNNNTPSASVYIKKITFVNGTELELDKQQIILIVGANNSGKSETLRSLATKLQSSQQNSKLINTIELKREGTDEDLMSVLSPFKDKKDPRYFRMRDLYLGHGHFYQWQNIEKTDCLESFYHLFCHFLDTSSRLSLSQTKAHIDLRREHPQAAIHLVLLDDQLEKKFSDDFKKAFGVGLIIDRGAGKTIPIYIGDEKPREGEDRVSASYGARLEKLPRLDEQGDGMKSYAGILLETSVGKESIFLIDEPEAFLHPPQARLLGETLGKRSDRQTFIATHSGDFLRGVLASNNQQIKVIRLKRQEGADTSVTTLHPDNIRELWKDPRLRHSNALDGLFHEMVVVCEADTDCRFYSAVLDAMVEHNNTSTQTPIKKPDVLFTHCGGKARLHLIAGALKKVDVPIKIIADLDLLQKKDDLRKITDALGIDWSLIEKDWRIVTNEIGKQKTLLSSREVKEKITNILSNVEDSQSTFPSDKRKEIETYLKQSSPWSLIKKNGINFIPSGDATKAYQGLNTRLKEAGLYLVEVGEVEKFNKAQGGHGGEWVLNVLEDTDLATDPNLQDARNFIKTIFSLG